MRSSKKENERNVTPRSLLPKRKDSMTFIQTPVAEDRLSIYETTIQLDELGVILKLDLQKDTRKMYFVLTERDSLCRKELSIYLKQATQVLMYCQNDFRRFVGEMLCVKHRKVTLRDINRVVDKLAIENMEY